MTRAQRKQREADVIFRRLGTGWSAALRDAFAHIEEYEGADFIGVQP